VTAVAAPMVPAGGCVRLSGVAVRLGGRTVWSDVDLDVEPGELVVVLGPNGAGKTTLLRVLLGMVAPHGGTVSVLGRPPGAAGCSVDYLPQRRPAAAETRIRARDVIALGVDGHRWGMPLPFGRGHRDRVDRVVDAAARTGVTDLLDRPVAELSGGELQRVLIAQAMTRRPRLLLLDEPLAGLDLTAQGAVAALLRRLCRTDGIAVVLVSHDVNPFLGDGPGGAPDRVVYVAAGHAATGPPEEVLTGARLSRLYGSPVEVLRSASGRLVVVGAGG